MTRRKRARNWRIWCAVKRGEVLREVGERHGISKERVRHIVYELDQWLKKVEQATKWKKHFLQTGEQK